MLFATVLLLLVVSTSACEPGLGFCAKNFLELVSEATIVINGKYVNEQDLTPTTLPQRAALVNSTVSVTSVYRCGASSCTLPTTIKITNVRLFGYSCADFRPTFVVGKDYVLLLKERDDGTYAQLDSLYQFAYPFNPANDATARAGVCGGDATCMAATLSLSQSGGVVVPATARDDYSCATTAPASVTPPSDFFSTTEDAAVPPTPTDGVEVEVAFPTVTAQM